jgi:hypothetical protein
MDLLIKIWSPEHLQNHANSLCKAIRRIGYNAVVSQGILYGDDVLYILYCPQVLPEYCWDVSRIKNYIVYHTEHAERFLTGFHNRSIFENAKAIWCHTPQTIQFLKIAYPNLGCELVPPGFVIPMIEFTERIHDVTFYGNISERRLKTLNMFIDNGIKVNLITNVFGKELLDQLLQSKVVLNLHYAPVAPLELFRIHEGLSMGCHVISEKSSTEGFKIDYTGIVHFMDDPYKMILWTKYLLDNQIKSNFDVAKLDNRSYVEQAMKKIKL